jgi:hypothetical protein
MRTPPRLIRADNAMPKAELTTKRSIVTIATQELRTVEVLYLLLQSTLGLRPSTQEGPELPHRIRCGASAGWREVDLRHAETTRFGGQDCRWRISNGNSQIALGPSWPPPTPANGDYWEVSSR